MHSITGNHIVISIIKLTSSVERNFNYTHLTSSSLLSIKTEVYASRYTNEHLLTISNPLTVMSVGSPRPRPTRYNILIIPMIRRWHSQWKGTCIYQHVRVQKWFRALKVKFSEIMLHNHRTFLFCGYTIQRVLFSTRKEDLNNNTLSKVFNILKE